MKLVKPGQDRRADLPTIGPETVRAAAAAGLRGIAFEAGGTLLAERDTLGGAADAAGLFLLGLDPTHSPTGRDRMSRFLHTMLRVGDLERSIDFYTKLLGMKELRRRDVPDGKYTLAFVGYGDEDSAAVIELTYNYGVDNYEMGTGFGHLAIGVPDVAGACDGLRAAGGEDHPRAGPGEVRHHDHRLRRGSGRLQDRTGAAGLTSGPRSWRRRAVRSAGVRSRPPRARSAPAAARMLISAGGSREYAVPPGRPVGEEDAPMQDSPERDAEAPDGTVPFPTGRRLDRGSGMG